jgi:hypothetical protein
MRFGSPSLKHVKSDLSTSNVSEITNFNVYYYFLVYVSIYFDIYQIHCYCIKPGKREVMCMYVRVILVTVSSQERERLCVCMLGLFLLLYQARKERGYVYVC